MVCDATHESAGRGVLNSVNTHEGGLNAQASNRLSNYSAALVGSGAWSWRCWGPWWLRGLPWWLRWLAWQWHCLDCPRPPLGRMVRSYGGLEWSCRQLEPL